MPNVNNTCSFKNDVVIHLCKVCAFLSAHRQKRTLLFLDWPLNKHTLHANDRRSRSASKSGHISDKGQLPKLS